MSTLTPCWHEECEKPQGHRGDHGGEETFCPDCFAGIASDEHRERCLLPAGVEW